MKTKANGLDFTSMETDEDYKSVPSKGKANEDEETRPNFVNKEALRQMYPCSICSDVVIRPHQTPCGCRACESCLTKLFGDRDHILPCPMSHDEMDEDDIEECQRIGLHKASITQDHAVSNTLLKQKCYCANRGYGCEERIPLRRLKDHEASCAFTPQQCPNKGCPEIFAAADQAKHLESCLYVEVKCSYCHQLYLKKNLESHVEECDLADTQCAICGKSFDLRKMLVVHQRISVNCVTKAGKCYYHDFCRFETDDVQKLRHHLENGRDEHLECLTLTIHNANQSSESSEEKREQQLKVAISSRVKPLEKVTAELTMKMIKYGKQMEASTTNGEALQGAMKVVNNTTQEVDNVKSRVSHIERQIKDSGLDRVTVIESHTQSIKRCNDQLTDIEKRVRNLETISYDGTIFWKIQDYKRRKSDAVRGKQMSIYSHPFFTSRNGYRMCLRAYLNGDGLGRGKCLSLFFVVMRGEYDELLQFPFKQRVTFTLLCPSNPELNKSESFLPDPESSSFRRPQTEMNIASGCPQFAPHSLVESSNFLIDDCIYIKAVVEPGGDKIL